MSPVFLPSFNTVYWNSFSESCEPTLRGQHNKALLSKMTNAVLRNNLKYVIFNATIFARKTGHFFRAVEGDCHDIALFKLTNSELFS